MQANPYNLTLDEVRSRVRGICHWFDADTELPVLHQHASQLRPGQVYLEIGTAFGCTAIIAALASLAGVQIWTIDNGIGYLQRLPDKFPDLMAYEKKALEWLCEYNVSDKVHFRCADSIQLPWHGPIHVLFIDGDHEYSAVKADILKWVDFVPRGGVVLFHDYYCPATPGVKKAVDDLPEPFWECIPSAGSLKAFRRR